MDTNLVRDKISRITETIKKLLEEAENIYKEGKRRARENTVKRKDIDHAEKNFSIETKEENFKDYH